jgi:hypothetical protein
MYLQGHAANGTLRATPLARPGLVDEIERSVVWHGSHVGTVRDLQLGTGESVIEPEHAEYRLEYRPVSAGCSLVQ